MARDGRPPLDEDSRRHVRQDLLQEKGVTLAVLKTYAVIRDHVGWEPADEDKFLLAWPSEATIAKKTGVHRTSVSRAVQFLADRDYLIVDRRPNRSSRYGLVVDRGEFRAVTAEQGRAEAIADWESRRSELYDESRAGQHEAAWKNRKPRQERVRGRKSQGGDIGRLLDEQQSNNSGGCSTAATSGCSTGADSASTLHRTREDLDLKNQIQPNQSATDDVAHVSSTPLTPELPKGNNSNGPSKETAQQQPPKPARPCPCHENVEDHHAHVKAQAARMKQEVTH